ncbi:MAG TPA: exopolysaccharide biosynthesis polyprenyl glycosylphosphotransferase [Arenibaculum sp.]|nr:exopolysaccharide biosynthesis polyprenyl glycosylphosphotransferase [Arenibaculum sp.]
MSALSKHQKANNTKAFNALKQFFAIYAAILQGEGFPKSKLVGKALKNAPVDQFGVSKMIRLFRVHIPLSSVLLIATDVFILFTSIWIGFIYQWWVFYPNSSSSFAALTSETAFVATTLTVCFGMGLHQRQYIRAPMNALARLAISFGIAFLILSTIFYVVPQTRIGIGALVPAVVIAFLGMLLARSVYRRIADIGLFRRRILVVGVGPMAAEIQKLAAQKGANFLCVGFIPDGTITAVDTKQLLPASLSVAALALRENVREVVLASQPGLWTAPTPAPALDGAPWAEVLRQPRRLAPALAGALAGAPVGDGRLPVLNDHPAATFPVPLTLETSPGLPMVDRQLADELLHCRLHGIRITDYLTFIEHEKGEVDLDNLYSGWLVLGEGYAWTTPHQRFAKRVFDLLASLGLLAFTLPLLLIVALAILIEDGRPVFYRQERVGLDERPFRLLKFRSMRVDAEKDGVARWSNRADPRVTRVGAFLRRTRLDEVPQILNVLRGEMSFVGPRPERPEFVDHLARIIPFYRYRHCVKPGITGWAQINFDYGASVDDARRKLQFDLYYIKNYSIVLDFMILVQTVRVVLWPPER